MAWGSFRFIYLVDAMNTEISSLGSYLPPATAKPAPAESPSAPAPAPQNSSSAAETAPRGAESVARVASGVKVQKAEASSTDAASTEPAPPSRSVEEQRAELEAALEKLNQHMRQNARDIEFNVDEMTNRTVITVRQRETGEIIRQIPSDGLLEFAHQVEMQLGDPKGLLFNSKT